MKLNLGGGGFTPDGYTELDRKNGQEIYPLSYENATAAEIRASHCLEHFPHGEVGDVLNEWVRVLEPGGTLKIAVPDFAKIAQWYTEKRPDLPLQFYVVGAQADENDYHKSVFDSVLLTKCLQNAGLVDIKPWVSEIRDNAATEVSLNLQGTKPKAEGWPVSEAANIYSQYGEDGQLRAIFDKIGTESQVCVDVGAADGLLFSNVRQFIEQGWKGVLIEADEKRFGKLVDGSGGQFGKGQVRCYNYKVEPTGAYSLDSLLAKAEVPEEFDLLSIDIDGQDYYIWNSLLKFRPRVVVIEYDPEVDPMFIPQLNGPGQAGWNAIAYVAAAKGYNCIARTQTNLICLRRDILEKLLKDTGAQLVTTDPGHARQPETQEPEKPVSIIAVASVPRLGFNATWHCTLRAMLALHIKMEMVEGVFFGQCMTRGIEKAIAQGAEYILTIDYDTVFDEEQVKTLCRQLSDHPEYDILVPVQMKREADQVLFQMNGSRDFSQSITPIKSGHFGLTVFDVNVFSRLPKPWFLGVPDPKGTWDDGRVDEDMYFWSQCEKAGIKVGSANEVRIGHLELSISWADSNFKKVRQSITEYRELGQPVECKGERSVEMSG